MGCHDLFIFLILYWMNDEMMLICVRACVKPELWHLYADFNLETSHNEDSTVEDGMIIL